jgi:2-dehydropantoate 2-reductase
MRIAVLGGGGAMGGLFGGWLARAGHDVALIDVSQGAISALNENGVSIDENDGSKTVVPVRATSDPASVGPVDLIVNFVKCYHTESAVRSAKSMLGADTAVLTLQNGWGNAARIASILGEERVLVGLTYHSATLLGPGQVKHPGIGMTFMGELDGRVTPRLEAAAAAFRSAGFDVTISERVLDEVWKKLALNVCTLPTAALLRFFAHELNQHDGTRTLMAGLLREVVAVANARGIALDYDELWAGIIGVVDRAIGAKPSMLQDVEAKRQTEIDVINGAIVEAGKRTGVATPLNDTMVWLVKSLEEAYSAAKA